MKNNQLIVESRETGKTTYLFNEIHKLIEEGRNVIVLDSATDHVEKSLLKKVIGDFKNAHVIDMRDENAVVLKDLSISEFITNFMNFFPFKDIYNNRNKVICFDLSYFLELGHDIFDETNDMKKYKYYRNLYNMLSQQIVLTIILMGKYGMIKNSIVVMDEIEFPVIDYDVSLLQDDIKFLASVHPENAFGSFYESFEKLDFKVFKRRKD